MSKYIIVEIDDEALELMRKNGDETKELIQCKDCTHSREIKPFGATELCCMRWGLFAVEPNGYCDRAERKGKKNGQTNSGRSQNHNNRCRFPSDGRFANNCEKKRLDYRRGLWGVYARVQ